MNNATTTSRTVRVVATFDSTRSDINRAFSLRWLKKDLKNDLLKELNKADSTKKNSDRIKRLREMLKELAEAKSEREINQQGYQVLTSDINWLISH